ncbi:MAG TPA: site-2 protease family protein [Candidatus Methylomirabilis sp.]|nr:site-2 protease family protein [Candidatus Methylomirabilis sp.]
MFGLPSVSTLVITIPVFLLALTIHEFAHGWVANWLGDPTARLQGRLTLNPLAHLDPIGTLAIVFIGFGWARPVPVDSRHLKRPQRDMMLIAAAGPVSNLLLGVASAFCVRMIPWSGSSPEWVWLVKPVLLMLYTSVGANVILAVFNLLPIPPLDGSRVLSGLLPLRQAISFNRLEPYGGIIIFLLFITGIMNPIFGLAQHTITRALLHMWG